jgi:hypothetical protein
MTFFLGVGKLLSSSTLYRNDFPSREFEGTCAAVRSTHVLKASTDKRRERGAQDDDGMGEENERKPISLHLFLFATKKYFQRILYCETTLSFA